MGKALSLLGMEFETRRLGELGAAMKVVVDPQSQTARARGLGS
ncbi:hypothetical protein [Consotaella aegiceratis]